MVQGWQRCSGFALRKGHNILNTNFHEQASAAQIKIEVGYDEL